MRTVNGAPVYAMGYVDGVVLDSPDKAFCSSSRPYRGSARAGTLIDVLAESPRRSTWTRSVSATWPARDGYIGAAAPALVGRSGTNSKTHRAAGDRDEVADNGWRPTCRRSKGKSSWPTATTDRQLPDRPEHRSHRRRARLGALHARRSAGRRRLPRRVLDRPRSTGPGRPNDPSGRRGFPTYAELLGALNADRTGRDLSGMDFYVAFSSWRLAVIAEGRVLPLPARRDGRSGHRARRPCRLSDPPPSNFAIAALRPPIACRDVDGHSYPGAGCQSWNSRPWSSRHATLGPDS